MSNDMITNYNNTWWLILLSKWVITCCYNPSYMWIDSIYPIF
jgi:hypothetical protein